VRRGEEKKKKWTKNVYPSMSSTEGKRKKKREEKRMNLVFITIITSTNSCADGKVPPVD
jgi:hypothetical protein